MKLYVGGISYNTTEQSMKQEFEKAGTVISTKIIMDRDSGRSKGFGFVEMASEDESKKAIEMFNNKDMDGRMVKVSEARPMVRN